MSKNDAQLGPSTTACSDQQSAIKMQQLEAIRLIQISLEKLSATATVTVQSPKPQAKHASAASSSILVYKEANLHRNLLVSKILNKAKYFYYQSIVQTMRLSLISKLNYYSSLIQQLNSRSASTSDGSSSSTEETSIVDEMKHLMHQILHETYQFNLNSSADEQISLAPHVVMPEQVLTDSMTNDQHICRFNNALNPSSENTTNTSTAPLLPTTTTSTTNNNNNNNNKRYNHISVYHEGESSPSPAQNQDDPVQHEKNKRIKQLNDVKISLYSLLFRWEGWLYFYKYFRWDIIMAKLFWSVFYAIEYVYLITLNRKIFIKLI